MSTSSKIEAKLETHTLLLNPFIAHNYSLFQFTPPLILRGLKKISITTLEAFTKSRMRTGIQVNLSAIEQFTHLLHLNEFGL